MLVFLVGALKVIILLGFLIFIHEFGHFTVAKLCNVRVNEFSLGFGPILLKVQGKETKYALRLIPLGGFVSMEGETEASNEERSFSKAKISKRIAIVAAGGLVNIFFAIIVFLPLQMIVVDNNISTKIESVIPGTSAEMYELQNGDVIKKINGKSVRIKSDIDKIMNKADGSEITLLIERDGQKIEKKIIPSYDLYYTTGIYFDDDNSTKIQTFAKDEESIEKYGLKIGDTIIKVAGVEVENDQKKMKEILSEHVSDEKINLVVKRFGKEESIDFELIKKKRYLIGANFAKADDSLGTRLYYGIIKTRDFVFSMVDNLRDLVTGQVKTRDFMGPIGISKTVVKTDKISSFISFMALISLSLGVTNLLPILPLDGGKIVLLIIEAIRKKPLDEKYEIGLQLLGFAAMIILALYVTFNDIIRII